MDSGLTLREIARGEMESQVRVTCSNGAFSAAIELEIDHFQLDQASVSLALLGVRQITPRQIAPPRVWFGPGFPSGPDASLAVHFFHKTSEIIDVYVTLETKALHPDDPDVIVRLSSRDSASIRWRATQGAADRFLEELAALTDR